MRTTHPLQPHHFALLDDIVRRLSANPVDEATRRAVTALTTDVDPDRADRLRVRPGEPASLVERLAVWALTRASDEAVHAAVQLLDPPDREDVEALIDVPADDPAPARR